MRHEAWRPAAGKVTWSRDLATTRSPSVFPTPMGMTQIDTREQRTPPKHFSNAPSQFSNPKFSLLNLPQGACDAKFVSPASANARRDRAYGRPIPKGAARPSGGEDCQRTRILRPYAKICLDRITSGVISNKRHEDVTCYSRAWVSSLGEFKTLFFHGSADGNARLTCKPRSVYLIPPKVCRLQPSSN